MVLDVAMTGTSIKPTGESGHALASDLCPTYGSKETATQRRSAEDRSPVWKRPSVPAEASSLALPASTAPGAAHAHCPSLSGPPAWFTRPAAEEGAGPGAAGPEDPSLTLGVDAGDGATPGATPG
ncbi:hypothetical protein H1C71_041968, partial [Ictidomys tridecemlineatus]